LLGIVAYFKAESWARSAGATLVEVMTEQIMDEMGLSEEEKSSASVPVREFTQKIRDGEASMEQIKAVAEEFAEGKAWAALLLRGFQTKYLEPSELTDDEKAAGRVLVGRFTDGLLKESIPMERLNEISEIVTYETTDADGDEQRKLKDSITIEELKSCLAIMKEAADKGGVEDREFTHDIGEMIGDAIDKGMARGAEAEEDSDSSGSAPPDSGE
jgi:hypothetical protein